MKLNAHAMVDLPAGARGRLEAFERLLVERAVPLGMISASDAGRVWERHILDSLRALPHIPPSARHVIDIGSGAGLPGVPIAVCRPDLGVTLVEPRSRRAGFLELVAHMLELRNVDIKVGRAEGLSIRADLCLARAVARAEQAWRLAAPLLAPGGGLLLWAGRSWPGREAARLSRSGVTCKICAPPGFSWEGPLVMIGGT